MVKIPLQASLNSSLFGSVKTEGRLGKIEGRIKQTQQGRSGKGTAFLSTNKMDLNFKRGWESHQRTIQNSSLDQMEQQNRSLKSNQTYNKKLDDIIKTSGLYKGNDDHY